MKGARWVLLALIAAMLGGAGVTYVARKKALREQSPPRPRPLDSALSSSAPGGWHTVRSEGKRPVYQVDADSFTQSKDAQRIDLKGVRLRLYTRDASAYDLITSAAATLTSGDNRFFSDGEVEITLGVPVAGERVRSLVSIKSSGISVDPSTGRAETDRPTEFEFRNGHGKSTGAVYDPTTGELLMKAGAEVTLTPKGPNAKPAHIEAGSLTYVEAKSEIWMRPWGRITRGDAVIEGADCLIRFSNDPGEDGESGAVLTSIDASHAKGSEAVPNRKLHYAADAVRVDFDDYGVVSKIAGHGNAGMQSVSPSSDTGVKADNLELFFANADGESALDRVLTSGHSEADTKPTRAAGRPAPESHMLRADALELDMRFGGREVEKLLTHSQGTLEFLPNEPSQRRRTLDAFRIAVFYGPRNEIETFSASDVKTRSEPAAAEKQRDRSPILTSSRGLTARFDPQTNRAVSIDQTGDFTYQEGDRHARADAAVQDEARDSVALNGSARVWDPSGYTSAKNIRLDRKTGDFSAEGSVVSSHAPDGDRKGGSDMLSGEEPIQAQAPRMTSVGGGRKIRYDGGAAMWQGASRIQADAIEIDKEKHTLVADGHVVTTLWDRPKPPAGGSPQAANPARPSTAGAQSPALQPAVTRAAHLTYSDSGRVAVYTGGVTLDRASLRVKSDQLHAYLSGADGSSLEKAVADGRVEIAQRAAGRPPRDGSGDHAEYYEGEQKVVLRGKPARMLDGGDATEGLELTYWTNDARLLVNGSPQAPVKTRITRDRK